jgi:hypothetical protein
MGDSAYVSVIIVHTREPFLPRWAYRMLDFTMPDMDARLPVVLMLLFRVPPVSDSKGAEQWLPRG